MLRAALPLSRDNDQRLAAVLSSLGWANCKMKNYAEAVRFYQQCMAIPGPYHEHAIRNLGVIQSERAGGRPASPATPPAPK
ncbi:MAG: tetratricopeptide repeat protein [Bryobacteraceae bacterium]